MTIKELLEKLQALNTATDAKRFLLQYNDKNMWANIKYVTGYLGTEERNRILTLFLS